jgi:hypothetical protein
MKASGARRTNTDIERYYFEQFRKAHSLPDGIVTYGDKPDVTLTGERKIGIEVTRFFLQSGSLPESEQRQKPLRAPIVSKAQALYRAGGGKGIELTIDFDPSNPITPHRGRKLPGELAALAKRIDGRPSGELERTEFQAMPEISFVYLNAREYPDASWRVIGAYSVLPMSSTDLEGIVREKEAKSEQYEHRDAYWLLVVVDAMDAAQEQEIRIDGLNIASEIFEKVIIYKPRFEHIIEAKS